MLRSGGCSSVALIVHNRSSKAFASSIQRICSRIRPMSTQAAEEASVKISKAMRAYLERAKAHKSFMAKERSEFEIGKRHLANIMGRDAEDFSQADVDASIEYLLPSGLYGKKAKPMLKSPEEIFPAVKEAQFDLEGRPFHSLFYTGLPNYYEAMFNISKVETELNRYEDERTFQGIYEPDGEIDFSGTEWLDLKGLQEKFLEEIDEKHAEKLILALERLMQHPYAYRCEDLLKSFRQPLIPVSKDFVIPEVKVDSDGVRYVETYSSRKTAHCWLTLREGNGKIVINGNDRGIRFFPNFQDREQVLFPFQITNQIFKFDVLAKIEYGGWAGRAGALRHAIAHALTGFLSSEETEFLRLAGLLRKDIRVKERKKPGQTKARKKWTWCKR